MTVTSIESDAEALTLTVIADFDAPADRVWQLWADPRKLERWWGPPSHPATVEEHELAPGGTVTYYMTGPEGDRHRGWWGVTAADPPRELELIDGFAAEDGSPSEDMPTSTMRMRLTDNDAGTRMELRSTFSSSEQMEQLTEMGMVEGIREAVGQMDALLVD